MESLSIFYSLACFDILSDEQDITFGINESISVEEYIPKELMKQLMSPMYLLCIFWKDTDTEQYLFYQPNTHRLLLYSSDTATLHSIPNLDPIDIIILIMRNRTNNEIIKTLIHNSDEHHSLRIID